MKIKEAIILLLLMNISIAFAAELTLEPEIINTKTEEEFTIDIILKNNESIFGIDFKLNKINGLNLLDHKFLNRTNNSMTNVAEQNEYMRFGILSSPNSTGISAGNKSIIRLKYKANNSIDGDLSFSNVFLSNKNGQAVSTTTKGSNITIVQPKASLSCIGDEGRKDETVTIKVYADIENSEAGGIDFYQNYDNKLRFITAEKTAATNNAILAINAQSGKIRIALAGVNITGITHILNLKYEITTSVYGDSDLEFTDITISDVDGELLSSSQNNDCSVTILGAINNPSGPSGSGGGGGSNAENNAQNQNTETPSSLMDSYSSLLDKGYPKESDGKNNEQVFYTQTEPEHKEEKTEKEEITEETNEKKTKNRSLPLALITLTALIGLAVVVVFELKK